MTLHSSHHGHHSHKGHHSHHGHRRDRATLVADLERQGLHFRTFCIAHDSPHPLADCDWNQRDLPHVQGIHSQFVLTPGLVTDDTLIGTYVQRVLGLHLPITVAYYQLDDRTRISQASLAGITVITEASLLSVSDGGTRVTTTYSLGARGPARLLLPLAQRFIRRNYQRIQDEDGPLLQRSQDLRNRGYRFADDDLGASYQRSLDLAQELLVPPEHCAHSATVNLDDGQREWRLGDDDILGLRVVRHGLQVDVHARICRHRGASLDTCPQPLPGAPQTCPWHGRQVPPLARFDLGQPQPQQATTRCHQLELQNNHLEVTPIAATNPA